MYYPRFWRRSSIGLVTLISLLALAIACGSAAAPEAAPQQTASSQAQEAKPEPTAAAPASAPASDNKAATSGSPGTPVATLRPVGISVFTPTPAPVSQAEPVAPPPDANLPKYGGHVPMADYTQPTKRHLHEWGFSHMKNAAPMFNLLVEYNPESASVDELRGDLATSWELLPDGLTYVFRLNPAARWHDGEPVDAEDVVFSLDSLVCPTCFDIMKDQTRSSTIMIKTAYEAGMASQVDDHTVSVTTSFPAPGFLSQLAIGTLVMMPKHTVIDQGKLQSVYKSEDLNGSGPFVHQGYKKDVANEYEKNDDYWKPGYPRIDGMTHFIIKDPSTLVASYKAGQVLMQNGPVTPMNALQAKKLGEDMAGELTVHWAGPGGFRGIVMNTRAKPFDDIRVRRAIMLALHRQPFIETLSGGLDLLGTPLPPGAWFSYSPEEAAQLPGFRELNGEKHPDDLAEAQRLMKEAGLENGFEIELSARNAVGYPDVAAIVAEQLKKYLNIDATLQVYESAAGYVKYDAGDVSFFVQGSSLNMMDPDAVMVRYNAGSTFTRWAAGGAVGTDYVVPGVEELHRAQAQQLDIDKRKETVQQIGDILLNEDNTYVGLFWSMRHWQVSNQIKGFYMHPSAYAYMKHEQIWCDPECK